MNRRLKIIHDYWFALKHGDVDALRKSLSDRFSHKADFEIKDTSAPINALGLMHVDDDRFSVNLVDRKTHWSYQVFCDNRFLYEEPVWFDEDGRIAKAGFAERCEFVEKVCYTGSVPVFSFCVREKEQHPINYIRVSGNRRVHIFTAQDIHKMDDIADDNFKPFTCENIHACECPFTVDVYIGYKDRTHEAFSVWVGGHAHEYFVDFSQARLDGKVLVLPPNRQRIWSVTGIDDNNDKEVILLPEDRIEFDNIVPKDVFLTDALDNDWKIRGSKS